MVDFPKDFGSKLANSLNEQVGTAENTPRNLDVPDPSDPNKTVAFGQLGEFSKKIDNTAQRSYIENGYIRNVMPRFFETLLQEPDATVVVKKKMFSSLINNYRFDLMDRSERNFIKASKRLFQNKCQVISIYEKLTKLQRIATENNGQFDDLLYPLLSATVDAAEGLGLRFFNSKAKSSIDSMNKWRSFSNSELFTTWIVEPSGPYSSTFGEGTGVFEITLATSISTNTSVKLGEGNISLVLEDPYRLMNITNEDIDHAIADTYNVKQTSNLFQFSENELSRLNLDLKRRLDLSRTRRGAPKVIIRTNNDSILNKRVRAFFDETGKEIIFTFDPGAFGVGAKAEFDPSVNEGLEGLTSSEENDLSQIIKNTYLILNLKRQKEANIDDVENEENRKEIQHIREKMRLQFGNKNIIQVMDSVHVYMGSKTTLDKRGIGIDKSNVYESGNNLLTALNSTVSNLEQSFNNVQGFFGPSSSSNSFIEYEKDAIMGPDFPTWLWSAIRNDFTRQSAGVHVAAGVVTNVSSSYSDGKYILNVQCQDNSYYFRMGETNINPGVAAVDREIFDPLTPFDLQFDASTGFLIGETPDLLPENESLLLSGSLKFKNGSRFANSPITKFLYGIGDGESKESSTRNYQKIFFDPDGFVYRWKSGIGTFTLQGPKHPPSPARERTSPRLTSDPFAGQDVMDVLSLLISGQPYNYNNFINNAVNNAALSRVEEGGAGNKNFLTNDDQAVSFFRGLVSDLQLNNIAWGNFIPFKKLVINEEGLKFLLMGQYSLQTSNSKLDNALKNRAEIFDKLTAADSNFASNPNISGVDILGAPTFVPDSSNPSSLDPIIREKSLQSLRRADEDILKIENELFKSYEQANTANGNFQIFGNDFSLSENYNEGVIEESQRRRQREEFRRKLKTLTLRRLWKVKTNEDPNLLIIDDQYDKDYDIGSFERSLAGKMNFMKSDYADTFTQIHNVSQILGLEVFADTQGHIQIKPPGYNKVPSSVFERLLRDRKRLFPKALESLFVSQIEGLTDRLEIIEDEIRLRGIGLGFLNDSSLSKKLNGGDFIGKGNFVFKFISSEETGRVFENPNSVRSLIQQDTPEIEFDKNFSALRSVEEGVSGQVRQTGLFDRSTQLRNIIFNPEIYNIETSDNKTKYEKIRQRLSIKKNENAPSQKELFSNDRGGGSFKTQGDILKITTEISTFISERQELMKTLRNAIRNIDQGISLNEDPNSRRAALFPDLSNINKSESSPYPSIIAHMIEDESIDDLGPGSGGRYIIKENQIISMNISEKPPDFSVVEVSGLFGEGQASAPNQGFEVSRGGNGIVSATGVDYDLWRMYGFKVSQSRFMPFISNPESQAAPLATWMLSEQRRRIISGQITVTGNEYYQPGEVVYIENNDLLFYVEEVAHNFNWGGNFTTTLTLTYGHNPGEYFPTMLDVVGKGLYSKQHQANLVRNIRSDHANGQQSMSTIVINASGTSRINNVERLVQGEFGDQNRASLTNLILAISGTTVPSSNLSPIIELRYYYNSDRGFDESSVAAKRLNDIANAVINWLKNPTKELSGFSGPGETTNKQPLITSAINNAFYGKKSSGEEIPDTSILDGLKVNIDDVVRITPVDLSDNSETRSASQKAWLAARQLTGPISPNVSSLEESLSFNNFNNGSISDGPKSPEDITKQSDKKDENNPYTLTDEERSLFSNVIDIWISFEPKSSTIETSRLEPAGQASQANQEVEGSLQEAQRNSRSTLSEDGESFIL